MNSAFSHLVWLGAGTATEFDELLSAAKKITLVDAREDACKFLKKKYTQSNIVIQQKLISVEGGNVQFTEYNLTEYSSIAPPTGLKTLFPGLKETARKNSASIAVTDFIKELPLEGEDNALVIDIPDNSLALLIALQDSGQFKLFKNLYVHTALDALYEGSANSLEITSFLEQHGYLLQQKTNDDPDLPWLVFVINPLYIELEKIKKELSIQEQAKHALLKELMETKQNLATQHEAKKAISKELENFKQGHLINAQPDVRSAKELAEIQIELAKQQHVTELLNSENDKNKQEIIRLKNVEQDQIEQLNKLQNDLDKVEKHAINRAEKIYQLEKSNRKLQEKNEQLEKRQAELNKELLKAEAQIDVIKDLLKNKISN